MMKTRLLAAMGAAVLMSGCSGLGGRIDTNFAQAESKASALLKNVGRTAPDMAPQANLPVEHDNGIWLGKSAVKLTQAALPPIFYESVAFDRSVVSLSELAERITLRSGIPVKVSADVLAKTQAGANGAANGAGNAGAGAQAQGGFQQQQQQQHIETPIHIVYVNGNFKGLLDTVAARFGVYWKYANGTIHFFHTDTRTFQINAIPGDTSLTATVTSGSASTGGVAGGAGGGNGGNSSSNSQNTNVASRLSVYSSIEKSISAMLSPYGKVVASPATGTITVVDTPDVLDQIASFVDGENKTLSQQVMINVTVLSVALTDSDEYGINWDVVYNNLRSKYGIRNTVAGSPGSVGFSAGILATASSKLAGTSLLINALSEQGKVRRQTTASVVTLNNQPVPVQVARQTSYLQSSQTTVTALVGSTTTLNPGTVTSGFNMSVLPHILPNGTVMLQFTTDISSLRSIRTVSSNGSTIETPEMDTRNFLQRVAMKSNETLIISGFEQTDDNLNHQGVGDAKNFLFGGGFGAKSTKEVLVVVITPVTMPGA
jgi:type IVB pilus formation R64 PilN family outer membrane protein